jgi:DNA alkylation repair enzyme
VNAIRRELRAADPAKAPGMQAYMKSAMPYHGVQTPALRRICRRLFDEHPLGSAAAWRATVLLLWREAGHREEPTRRWRWPPTAATAPSGAPWTPCRCSRS